MQLSGGENDAQVFVDSLNKKNLIIEENNHYITVKNALNSKNTAKVLVNDVDLSKNPLIDIGGSEIAYHAKKTNKFTGTKLGDVIDARTIKDGFTKGLTLNGGAGNDIIFGTGLSKADTIHGGAGSDTIFGITGNNKLYGGAGSDNVIGGAGNDKLYGDAGNDTIRGNQGNNILSGGAGNDEIWGGLGKDSIDGGAGNDTLHGGANNCSIVGGAGNDFINGGSGDDKLYGGAGSDTIYGDTGNNVLSGGAGNDVIFGGSGKDSIDGGAGNDILFGGEGNCSIVGGAGNDFIKGGSGDDKLYGGTGSDTIYGGAGNSSIVGGAGNDVLMGGEGNDTIYGGAGNDTLIGGYGNTTFKFGSNNGSDSVYGGLGTDNSHTLAFDKGTKIKSVGYTDNALNIKYTDPLKKACNVKIMEFSNTENIDNIAIGGIKDKSIKDHLSEDNKHDISSLTKTTSVKIIEYGGNDTLNINAKANDLRVVMNVEKVGDNQYQAVTDYVIFTDTRTLDTDVLKGLMTGDYLLGVGVTNKSTEGDNGIETLKLKNKSAKTEILYGKIAEEVGKWLNGTSYNSALDAVNAYEADKTIDISGLVSAYNKNYMA